MPIRSHQLGRRACGIILCLGLLSNAMAQTRPDTGTVIRETAPPVPGTLTPRLPMPVLPKPPAPRVATPPARFVLKSVVVSGNTVFKGAVLHPYALDWFGREITLADLEQIAQRVTDHYRRAGYFLAQVVIPPQGIRNGSVEILVVEGSLGRVRVERDPGTPVPERLTDRMLERLPRNQPLTTQALEHAMLLLADLPGLNVQSALEQGEKPGTTDLVITLQSSRRWDLSLDVDNHGSRSVGEYRFGVLGRIRSPLALGDNLDLRLLRSSGADLTFGRLGYELPVNAHGTRAGIALSRIQYELGRDFAALDATGTANILDATVTHPLIRGRAENLFAKAGWMEKRLEDRLGSLDSTANKRSRVMNAGLTYEVRDTYLGGGYNSASVSGSLGELKILSSEDLATDQSATGHRTHGSFAKLNYQFSRLQWISADSTLHLGLAGQATNKNLDSSEKLAMGGPAGVRAYPSSEGIIDDGQVANIEYRYSFTHAFTGSAFYDLAHGRVNYEALPNEENERSLRGYGLGVRWTEGGFSIRASLAWRDSPAARSESGDRNPRLFAQMIKAF